jgi:hypothetical protein
MTADRQWRARKTPSRHFGSVPVIRIDRRELPDRIG